VKGAEPPDFVDGKMFTGTFPGFNKNPDEFAAIRAVDPRTGEKKWDYRLAAPSTEAGILTTASDVLFSGGRDGLSMRSMRATASSCGKPISVRPLPPGPLPMRSTASSTSVSRREALCSPSR